MYCDVTLILHQDKTAFLECLKDYPELKTIKVYSTSELKYKSILNLLPRKISNAIRARYYTKSLTPADGNLLMYYPVLIELLNQQNFDAAILETHTAIHAGKVIRRKSPKVKVILDAHNVETNLAKSALAKGVIGIEKLYEVQKLEKQLSNFVDAVMVCSNDDMLSLKELDNQSLPFAVIPNGVEIPDVFIKSDMLVTPKYIIFCGSLNYRPNGEGLKWFVDKVWPEVIKQLPQIKLLIIGNGSLSDEFSSILSAPQLEIIGRVDHVRSWYERSSLAIVPLLSGSGTRLKILEGFGYKVPVVSTTIGAEGIDYIKNKHIAIADLPEEFAQEIIHLLSDHTRRNEMAENAYKLAREHYNWDVIGQQLNTFISKILMDN